MSTELERFRDHARAMADFQPGRQSEACAGNHNPWTVTTWREPDHDACKGGDCRCSCHEPTTAERTLWRQLAAEVDQHLAGACPVCGRSPDELDGEFFLVEVRALCDPVPDYAPAHACTPPEDQP